MKQNCYTDFQTAPYEALCGCVAVVYNRELPPDHIVQSHIRQCVGQRNVCANCKSCNGTGIRQEFYDNGTVENHELSRRYYDYDKRDEGKTV